MFTSIIRFLKSLNLNYCLCREIWLTSSLTKYINSLWHLERVSKFLNNTSQMEYTNSRRFKSGKRAERYWEPLVIWNKILIPDIRTWAEITGVYVFVCRDFRRRRGQVQDLKIRLLNIIPVPYSSFSSSHLDLSTRTDRYMHPLGKPYVLFSSVF